MLKFIVRRFFSSIITIFVIITVAYFLIRAVPGDPFSSEKNMPKEIRENLNRKFHLDQPLYKQYFMYLNNLVFHFDFGPSFRSRGFSVNDLIKQYFPVSLLVGSLAMIIAVILGVSFGMISALNQNKFGDYFFMSYAILGISVPMFVIVPIFLLIFSIGLKILPVGGWKRASDVGIIGMIPYLIIPVFSLSLPYTAYITRMTKAGMMDIIRKDFVTTARAKGLKNSTILFRHIMKGSIIPVVSYVGPAFAGIVTGSVVVEQILGIPGMGRVFVQAAFNRDYSLVMGDVITYSLLIIVMNFVVDILYGFLDPRVKYS
ncbi:MAG: ABC transporter permease subunit [Exilispira sp.]|jgi:oligopeptide transport system permease protein|nr:ABC transporter permease subunit [Exilispira sp.]